MKNMFCEIFQKQRHLRLEIARRIIYVKTSYHVWHFPHQASDLILGTDYVYYHEQRPKLGTCCDNQRMFDARARCRKPPRS
jgi:hypothetical protein